MGRRGIEMSAADVAAHQAKHGFAGHVAPSAISTQIGAKLPKPVRMTIPEREYGLILAAMKGRKEIQDYRFQGMSLAWGRDPSTGILMRYKCDYVVFLDSWQRVKIVEVKGAHIFERDLIRFKGCRAEWPMFQFELHQRDKDGVWRQVL